MPEQLSFRGTLNSSGSVKKNWSPVSIKTEVLNFTLYEVTAPLVKSAGVIEIESSRLINGFLECINGASIVALGKSKRAAASKSSLRLQTSSSHSF